MAIRQATMHDVPNIECCAREAYGKYVERIGRKPAPMVADFSSLVNKGVVYVSVENSDLQGFIVFYPRDDRMHLENVAVAIASQGNGIGRKLIEFCENTAHKSGCAAVELYTNEMMTGNLELYPRLGYMETGRRTEDGFNRVYFEKILD